METNIIVTGFKPFASYSINSSWEAAKVLKMENPEIYIKEISVEHLAAHFEITQLLEFKKCQILMLAGLAPYQAIKIETQARKPKELVDLSGESLLHGNWPWEANITLLSQNNVPTAISTDAGEYVCESIYWSALDFKKKRGYPEFISFFHVPELSPLWTAEKISAAMRVSLNLVTDHITSRNKSDFIEYE